MTSTTSSASAQGDEAFDARAFRRCLGMYATGVTVITAEAGDQKAGVTANSFSSLSLDPPLILWSISRTSRSFPVFRDAKHFAVNILGTDQIDVSQCFSSSDADKFARVSWKPGDDGAPLIDGVVARFECSTEVQHDGGDHVLIIGRVRRFAQFDGTSLLFAQGRYGIAEDHPNLKQERQIANRETDGASQETPLMRLLFQAHHFTYDHLEDQRQDEGLTIPQVRVLHGLNDSPRIGIEALAKRMYLGPRDTEDAVAELIDSGDVMRTETGLLELTESGRERRISFRRRMAQFEADYLAGIPPEEVASGRRFLERLISKRRSE